MLQDVQSQLLLSVRRSFRSTDVFCAERQRQQGFICAKAERQRQQGFICAKAADVFCAKAQCQRSDSNRVLSARKRSGSGRCFLCESAVST
ncbi:hypothetical protein [Lysinibacillus sp. TE18511]